MEAITVKELLAAVHGELLQGDETAQILGVNTDSRTVKSGEVFVPLVGERFDGHDYIEKATFRGRGGLSVRPRAGNAAARKVLHQGA